MRQPDALSMQERIDRFDWSQTPIGAREAWPQSLRTSLSICLASRFPILIWWGPELIKLYNDAYAQILGTKHPQALGRPGRDVWPEIWPIIGPMLTQVMREGKATWSDDQMLLMDRHGYAEETYFTFSYSPIVDESGGIGGIFTAVFETTSRVIGQRRLDTLRELAARASVARSVEEACRNAADLLEANPHDVPFAAIYLRRPGNRAECIAAVGRPPVHPPSHFDWNEPPEIWPGRAIALPLNVPGEEETTGLLVAGISPHRALDDDYRAFYTLVAGHITTVIADARAYEVERQRAEALAELDRAKTAFFSNVSHEFRTPLTLMLGPIEELLAADEVDATTRDRLALAHRNALRLLKLVNTLLDFSRIEAGRIDAAYEPTALAELTADLAGVFRSAIERAGLRFLVDCPPLSEPVYVDRELWEKLVLNLLSNAFKFTFDGEIEVALREHDDRVELTVRDTGTGIPEDELPHLFERFHRVKNARGRTFEGSGIGLALVQELARLHGGSVRAESVVDRGTTFTVSIPRGSAHLPPERIGAPRKLATSSVRGEMYLDEPLRALEAAPETAPDVSQFGGERARILLADDNDDMREYVQRILGHTYEVEAVADGAAALDAARRKLPDLVLSDVMMPVLDGFELLRALRGDERTCGVPVILLSARAGEESRVEGLEAGADDYLIKPFSAKELLARVDAHVRMQRIRRDVQRALAASEAKFATAFDRSPLALTITSAADGRLIDVNDGFVRLTGYSRAEALGRTPEELGLWIDPEVRAAGLARMRAGEHITDVEASFRMKDGSQLTCMVGAALVDISGRPCILTSVVDITDRKRAEEAKDAFLATLSHELRTPLTSGYGWAKLLARTRDPQMLDTGLRAIEESFANQMKLIDDLLDVSRIVSGKLHVDFQPLDLGSVIDAAVEMVRPSAEAKQIALRVGARDVVPVYGDATRLKQVFGNLLVNAIKFTPRGGAVDVALRHRDDGGAGHAEVVVRDTGEGIDPKFLPHVFDRFRQADASSSRKHGGLGLGLAIVSSLVEAHSGNIRAESEGIGKGSSFIVTLPLLEHGSRVAAAETAHTPRDARELAGTRILVVDDDPGARQLMTRVLQSSGATVLACANAADAFKAVNEWRPDVLVSDLAMPHEDGYALLRRLREHGKRLPALAITAYVRPEDEERVREAGFARHVAKPFDPDELLRAVQALRS
ncbi:MAG: response regulator [Acidobacteria bacterium]|nr:response regulator [Acidobacteriota bacterium]MBV9476299.1 response regulator [Acidobacteriota bacterium]